MMVSILSKIFIIIFLYVVCVCVTCYFLQYSVTANTNKKLQFLHLLPPGGLTIVDSRVEHDTPRNGPVAAGRIASEWSNFNRCQPSPSFKRRSKNFRLAAHCAATTATKSRKLLFKKKVNAIISYLPEATVGKSSPNLTILFPRTS